DVDARARLRHGDLAEQIDRRVVVHVAVLHDPAMAVVGVLAQAGVPDHEQVRRTRTGRRPRSRAGPAWRASPPAPLAARSPARRTPPTRSRPWRRAGQRE